MTRYVFWTAARVADLRSYAERGMSITDIAAKFGRTTKAIHWQTNKHRIKVKYSKARPWPEWHNALVRSMAAKGCGWKEIALALGKNRLTVADYARRNGIKYIGRRAAEPAEAGDLRKCLACGDMFPSKWIGNRRCKPCTASPVYKTSGSAMI